MSFAPFTRRSLAGAVLVLRVLPPVATRRSRLVRLGRTSDTVASAAVSEGGVELSPDDRLVSEVLDGLEVVVDVRPAVAGRVR